MENVLQWIAQYWVSWVCALLAGGIIFFAKRYISMEKKNSEEKWKDKAQSMHGEIIANFNEKINEIKTISNEKESKLYQRVEAVHDRLNKSDKIIFDDLSNIHGEVNTIEAGILSIQGKQFRDMCEDLLQQDHISVDEYQEFEEEYSVYKSLGGNHRGDALHERVVAKFDKQSSKKESE